MQAENSRQENSAGLVQLSFTVLELRGVTEVGGGACCALPTDFLIDEALRALPAVRKVAFPGYDGVVQVWVTEPDLQIANEIVECIESLGLTVGSTTDR